MIWTEAVDLVELGDVALLYVHHSSLYCCETGRSVHQVVDPKFSEVSWLPYSRFATGIILIVFIIELCMEMKKSDNGTM